VQKPFKDGRRQIARTADDELKQFVSQLA